MAEARSARFIETSAAGVAYDDSEASGPDLFAEADQSAAADRDRERIVTEVAASVGITTEEAAKTVGAVLDAITGALERGDEVRLRFGTLSIARTKQGVKRFGVRRKFRRSRKQPGLKVGKELG
jgi:DNA-binding protein HU-beta